MDPARVRFLIFRSGRYKPTYAEMLNLDWTIDMPLGHMSNPHHTRSNLDAAIKVIKEFYAQAKSGR